MQVQAIKKKGYTEIRLNRPDKRNALSCALMQELLFAFEEVHADRDQCGALLLGKGPVFCAGLDLQEMADENRAKESAALLSRLLKMLYFSRLVTVCGVHGASVAGGAALMSACDLVLAEENTLIGFPEVRRGIVAGFVSALLIRQMRIREIKELLLIGEPVSARRAQEMGLVNAVVPDGSLEPEAEGMVKKVLKGAPQTLRMSKELLKKLELLSPEHSWEAAEGFHFKSRNSAEAQEGALAFLEKREAKWTKG